MTKINRIIIILLLISHCLFADINGDLSIGKDNDVYRAEVKLGYDFTISKFAIVPYIDYINYFRMNSTGNHPFRDIFGTGLRIIYNDVYLDVRHECRHEVSSINSLDTPMLYSDALPNASSTFITVGYRFGKDFD